MNDIVFDIEKMNVVLVNGDFTTTDNPSVQNGGLLLLVRGNNWKNLGLGIGINQVRGGSVAQANYEMNRWKQQVYTDGGRATVSSIQDGAGNVQFNWQCNYE